MKEISFVEAKHEYNSDGARAHFSDRRKYGCATGTGMTSQFYSGHENGQSILGTDEARTHLV